MGTTVLMQQSDNLLKRLLQEHCPNEQEVSEVLKSLRVDKIKIIPYLKENYSVSSLIIAKIITQELDLPFFDLSDWSISLMPQDCVKISVIEKYRVIPLFKMGKVIHLAISDPHSLSAIELITFHTQMDLKIHIVEEDKLSIIIKKVITTAKAKSLDILNKHFLLSQKSEPYYFDFKEISDEKSIIQFIKSFILDAISEKISDIHFEPYETYYRIRFRKDGLLKEIIRLPTALSQRLSASLKVMAHLDSTETRIPQDGHIKLGIDSFEKVDLRLSTCPTIFGEKIVLRILDQAILNFPIEKLGLENFQENLLLNAISKPQGLILITGPTGSGKTITLYSILNILNRESVNIMTCEDPVEIFLSGIQQVNIQPKIGFHFATAIRAFLRQDPDVIMIGEIRDQETAHIALQAAETGHLVLSTLHTNSAIESISRLLQMGIPSYVLDSTVNFVIAQRLVRRLCQICKIILPISLAQERRFGHLIDNVDSIIFYGPKGCTECYQGYLGRIGIFEILQISDNIQNSLLIESDCKSKNQWSLEYAGFSKAIVGLTSLEEIMRVL